MPLKIPTRVKIVKPILLAVLLVIGPTLALAEDWRTIDGTTYQNVKVIKVADDAITIIYKDGGAMVPLSKLPAPLQKRFAYDPVNASDADDARAKAAVANAKALQAEINQADKIKKAQAVKEANATSEVSTTTAGH